MTSVVSDEELELGQTPSSTRSREMLGEQAHRVVWGALCLALDEHPQVQLHRDKSM